MCMCMCTCIYICIYVYMYRYIYIHTHICIYIYIYMYIYTHTHTHTYIYIYVFIYIYTYMYTITYFFIYMWNRITNSYINPNPPFTAHYHMLYPLPKTYHLFIYKLASHMSASNHNSYEITSSIHILKQIILILEKKIIHSYMKWYVPWRGGGLGSRPKKMYGERLGDVVKYHLMSPTPRR